MYVELRINIVKLRKYTFDVKSFDPLGQPVVGPPVGLHDDDTGSRKRSLTKLRDSDNEVHTCKRYFLFIVLCFKRGLCIVCPEIVREHHGVPN